MDFQGQDSLVSSRVPVSEERVGPVLSSFPDHSIPLARVMTVTHASLTKRGARFAEKRVTNEVDEGEGK